MPPEPKKPRFQPIHFLAIAAVFILAAAALALRRDFWDPSRPVRRVGNTWEPLAGEFAGSAACRECHAEVCAQQEGSHHARTVRILEKQPPKGPLSSGQAVADPLTGARYRMLRANGEYAVSVRQGDLEARQPVQFEFGSGRQAHGYIGVLGPDRYLDCRLNWYRATGRWWFASGQEKPLPTITEQPLGRPLGAGDAALCFSCHATLLRAWGVDRPGRQGREVRLDLKRSVLNITCERCHGPQGQHVRRAKAGLPAPSRHRFTAEQVNSLCGECHSVPDLTPDHPAVARFQPYGLARSRCYEASAGQLSCLTCHNPHENLRTDPRFYEARCLSCHSAGAPKREFRVTVCPVNTRSGCVGCHMPRDSKSMLYVTFTDHRIRRPDQRRRPATETPGGSLHSP